MNKVQKTILCITDTLVTFELSNMELNSLKWDYDPTVLWV